MVNIQKKKISCALFFSWVMLGWFEILLHRTCKLIWYQLQQQQQKSNANIH